MCQNLSAVKASGQGGILDLKKKIIFNITIFILPKKKQKGGGSSMRLYLKTKKGHIVAINGQNVNF